MWFYMVLWYRHSWATNIVSFGILSFHISKVEFDLKLTRIRVGRKVKEILHHKRKPQYEHYSNRATQFNCSNNLISKFTPGNMFFMFLWSAHKSLLGNCSRTKYLYIVMLLVSHTYTHMHIHWHTHTHTWHDCRLGLQWSRGRARVFRDDWRVGVASKTFHNFMYRSCVPKFDIDCTKIIHRECILFSLSFPRTFASGRLCGTFCNGPCKWTATQHLMCLRRWLNMKLT